MAHEGSHRGGGEGSHHRSEEKSSQGGRGSPAKASPVAVERYLKGMDYPANKQDLINHARNQHAPNDVMEVLQKLHGDQFDSPIAVSQAVGEVE